MAAMQCGKCGKEHYGRCADADLGKKAKVPVEVKASALRPCSRCAELSVELAGVRSEVARLKAESGPEPIVGLTAYERQKAWRLKNPERYREQQQKYQKKRRVSLKLKTEGEQ